MGRSVQTAQFGVTGETRYFVYCETTECSLAPLFATEDAAWVAYGSGSFDAAAVRLEGAAVAVVRVRHSDRSEGEWYNLATSNRLLFPGEDTFSHNDRQLLLHDGVMHAARLTDGGFAGQYAVPVCAGAGWEPGAGEEMWLGTMYGKEFAFCAECLRALIEKQNMTKRIHL